ncbi:MAG: phosphoenolpyruvate carboxykinase (ATP), partial [Thermoanaerobacterales bacterium]|nr:phosphoenolpyruvate carboxykinase (ATP) [Thermoanaerobacterales bacterium]
VYADLLGEKIEKYNANVFLVNTGWSGGPYGIGSRMDIDHTRSIISAALNGQLDDTGYEQDPVFKLMIPKSCPGVPSSILNPRNTWDNKDSYDNTAKKLAQDFNNNISKFSGISREVLSAGPA